MIIHNPYKIIKCADVPLSLSFHKSGSFRYNWLFKFYNDTSKSYLAQGNSAEGCPSHPPRPPLVTMGELTFPCVVVKFKQPFI